LRRFAGNYQDKVFEEPEVLSCPIGFKERSGRVWDKPQTPKKKREDGGRDGSC